MLPEGSAVIVRSIFRSNIRVSTVLAVVAALLVFGGSIVGIVPDRHGYVLSVSSTSAEGIDALVSLQEEVLTSGGSVKLAIAGLPDLLRFGEEWLFGFLDALARLRADRKEKLAEILHTVLDMAGLNCNLLVITSELDADLSRALSGLSLLGVNIQCVILVCEETAGPIIPAPGVSVTALKCSDTDFSAQVVYEY